MTFLNPIYLIGLLAVSLPIIIHLWYQKRLKRVPFSTLKFLKKTEAKRFGWLRFRELLILFLRCLLIACLFLGFAQPVVKTTFIKFGRLASVCIIIDNSYSMQYDNNFQQAKKQAKRLLTLYSPQSEFCILPLCSDSKKYSAQWQTKKKAEERIEKIDITYKTGRLAPILNLKPKTEPHFPVDYFYIGDGQAMVFKGLEPDDIPKNFYWLKIPSGSNIGIVRVALKDPVAIPYKLYKLIVELKNYSSRSWQGKVALSSGPFHLEKECQIDARTKATCEFSLPKEYTVGRIKIYDDSLRVDNTYYFSKFLPRKAEVLIKGPSRYLRLALETSHEGIAPFRITNTDNLLGFDLRKFDFIILNGIKEISGAERLRLESFLSNKEKGVVCFLGNEVGQELKSFLARTCAVGEKIDPEGYLILDGINYQHPIFKIFIGSTSLKSIEFYRFRKILASRGIVANIAKRYPLIVVNKNLAVIAAPFLPEYTNIIYKTSFVPLLHRLLLSLTINGQKSEFYIGEETPKPELRNAQGEALNLGEKFCSPGFYYCGAQTLGVNVEPQEGDLKTFGEMRLNALGIKPLNLAQQLSGNNLSQLFFYLALLALAIELILLLIH